MESNCGISMVIATKGRVKLLENLIVSIDKARANYSGSTELLIVDDSNEPDKAVVEQMCAEHNARYIYLTPSVSAKRNLGAREASYPIVLFLDSDCLVTESILNEHAACYAKSEKVGAVCGLLEFTGEGGPFWDAVSKSQFVVCFDMAKWGSTVPWGTTANFSIRKDVFLEIDGFDESFPNKPGGEDVDFGLRIVKAGYVIAANPNALVYHDKATWTPVKAMFRRCWYYGNADTYIMEKHPDKLVGQMPRRILLCFCALILSVIMAFAVSPWCLLAFPIWLISDYLVTALCANIFCNHKNATLSQQFTIQALILTNEVGFITSCIKKKELGLLFKQLVYFDNQLKGISYNAPMLTLCITCNTLILTAFYYIIMIIT